MKICVLIPAHNEAKAIATVVAGVKAKGLDVVVIDDGSADGTAQIAKDAGATVLVNNQRSGKGKTLRNGFHYCITQDYHGIIMMDGDGQHATSDLDQFLLSAKKHPVSLISGNRMVNAKGMPALRYLTNRFMSLLISAACRQNIPDTQCGYRYINVEILKQIKWETDDFQIETEMLMKTAKKGYPIYSVPIQTIYEDEVSKINPVKDTIRFASYFFKEILRRDKK